MYRNHVGWQGARYSRVNSRRSAGIVRAGSALAFALLSLASAPAWGATVNIQCPRLTDPAKGELEARARLFLTSADMENAAIGVECDAANAWLVWTDGSKSPIDARTNIVEGTLDAIEDRIAKSKRGAAAGSGSGSGEGGTVSEGASKSGAPGDTGSKRPADVPPEEPKLQAQPVDRGIDLEGGVGLALLSEFWSGGAKGAIGPRLDVGVGIGRKFAVVISEGARFGLGDGSVMLFDLQAGIAYGAPYQVRTGFGVMALVGAERLSSAAKQSSSNYGGIWTWAATASLGGRGSVALGPVDAWIGIDGFLRSQTLTTGDPSAVSIPELAAVFSVGFFLPAFAGGTKNEPVKQVE
jgi:hypothetical protein